MKYNHVLEIIDKKTNKLISSKKCCDDMAIAKIQFNRAKKHLKENEKLELQEQFINSTDKVVLKNIIEEYKK